MSWWNPIPYDSLCSAHHASDPRAAGSPENWVGKTNCKIGSLGFNMSWCSPTPYEASATRSAADALAAWAAAEHLCLRGLPSFLLARTSIWMRGDRGDSTGVGRAPRAESARCCGCRPPRLRCAPGLLRTGARAARACEQRFAGPRGSPENELPSSGARGAGALRREDKRGGGA